MTDITDSRVLWLKFVLFVVCGAVAAGGALVLFPSWRLGALMAVTVWAFCRAYYFAFYVVERYIDRSYRFAGLGSLLRYAVRHRVFWRKAGEPASPGEAYDHGQE